MHCKQAAREEGGSSQSSQDGCRARVVASPRGSCWATRRPLAAQPQARARVDGAACSCPRLPHAARRSRGCGSVADSPERASAAPESRVGHPQPSFIPPKPRGGGGTATAWRAGPRERHTGEGEKPSQRRALLSLLRRLELVSTSWRSLTPTLGWLIRLLQPIWHRRRWAMPET